MRSVKSPFYGRGKNWDGFGDILRRADSGTWCINWVSSLGFLDVLTSIKSSKICNTISKTREINANNTTSILSLQKNIYLSKTKTTKEVDQVICNCSYCIRNERSRARISFESSWIPENRSILKAEEVVLVLLLEVLEYQKTDQDQTSSVKNQERKTKTKWVRLRSSTRSRPSQSFPFGYPMTSPFKPIDET